MENNGNEEQNEHNIPGDNRYSGEPSNALVWIVLFLLAVIIMFFLFGGGHLFGAQ